MASDFSTISTALAAKLNGISEIGNVHIGWPLVTNWAEYLAEAKHTTAGGKNVIRIWVINRDRIEDIWATTTQSYLRQTWTITGYLGYADGITTSQTEAEFQEFIESVFTAIRGDYSLSNIVDVQSPPALDVTLEKFGRIACHVARITLVYEVDKTF